MNTKLTLTIEKTVIERAKNYAEKNGQSLSSVVENYLRSITRETSKNEIPLTPLVKSLKGAFRMPADFDYKEELQKALSEKYLKND